MAAEGPAAGPTLPPDTPTYAGRVAPDGTATDMSQALRDAAARIEAQKAAAEAAGLAEDGRQLGALRVWLVVVAAMRLTSVWVGFREPERFRTHLFAPASAQVSDLYGRTFGVWTAVTCSLCLLCARAMRTPGPTVTYIYQATLLSFVAAAVHFILETFVYGTMNLAGFASPAIVSGVSIVWLAAWYRRACAYKWNDATQRSEGRSARATAAKKVR